jgi:hypothetical protein
VNGDGLADLIVGAWSADPGGHANAGESYVVFGKADTTPVNLSLVAAGTDLDGSGDVGFDNLLTILSAWGACPPECPQDLDANGNVGFSDLLIVLSTWGPCPE